MKQVPPLRVSYTQPYAKEKIVSALIDSMKTFAFQEVVCVCIGTDRSTGDALGPLVGSYLAKQSPNDLVIFGTLDEPVHALNLQRTLNYIKEEYPNALVIAIDACLGKMDSVGSIQVGTGPIKPGAGVNKQLPEVGQIHVVGIVNIAGFMEYVILQNTRLSVVMNMAEVIASSLLQASCQWKREHQDQKSRMM